MPDATLETQPQNTWHCIAEFIYDEKTQLSGVNQKHIMNWLIIRHIAMGGTDKGSTKVAIHSIDSNSNVLTWKL